MPAHLPAKILGAAGPWLLVGGVGGVRTGKAGRREEKAPQALLNLHPLTLTPRLATSEDPDPKRYAHLKGRLQKSNFFHFGILCFTKTVQTTAHASRNSWLRWHLDSRQPRLRVERR